MSNLLLAAHQSANINKPFLWIIIFIVIIGFASLIPGLIRKWDFNRQVKGKIPERDLPKDTKFSYDKKDSSLSGTDAVGAAGEMGARRGWMNNNKF